MLSYSFSIFRAKKFKTKRETLQNIDVRKEKEDLWLNAIKTKINYSHKRPTEFEQ